MTERGDAVVGRAGVIGAATSYVQAGAGLRVCLVERGAPLSRPPIRKSTRAMPTR